MPDLTVTLLQCDLAWEDIDANLSMFDGRIDGIEEATDLIVLPEMFSTGFSMHAAHLAESMDGKAMRWLRAKAARKKTVITGSLMIADGDRFYNRLVWAGPDGALAVYDKKHLFAFAGEDQVYTAGQTRVLMELNGWRIRPFICYDLRFPVWTRNMGLVYDLALFVANWPARRATHWRALLKARAIENQAHVVGLNRVGTDGNGLDYDGHSAVVAPSGVVQFEAGKDATVQSITLKQDALAANRDQFPFWRDADTDMVIKEKSKEQGR